MSLTTVPLLLRNYYFPAEPDTALEPIWMDSAITSALLPSPPGKGAWSTLHVQRSRTNSPVCWSRCTPALLTGSAAPTACSTPDNKTKRRYCLLKEIKEKETLYCTHK